MDKEWSMEGQVRVPVGPPIMEGPLAKASHSLLSLFLLGAHEALGAVGREHPAPLVRPGVRLG